MKEHHLSIWFIIGLQLVILGVIVGAASIYGIYNPPANPVKYEELHPGIYEGAAMLILGLVYTIKYRPNRKPPE